MSGALCNTSNLVSCCGEDILTTSPNPQTRQPPLDGCQRLITEYTPSYLLLYPQPQEAPCRYDRDPLNTKINTCTISPLQHSDNHGYMTLRFNISPLQHSDNHGYMTVRFNISPLQHSVTTDI
jgi:hypothetical protein